MKYKAAQCLIGEDGHVFFVIPDDMEPGDAVVGRKMSDRVLAQVQSWKDAVAVAYAVNAVQGGRKTDISVFEAIRDAQNRCASADIERHIDAAIERLIKYIEGRR